MNGRVLIISDLAGSFSFIERYSMTINRKPHGALHLSKGLQHKGKDDTERQRKREGYLRLHYSVSTTVPREDKYRWTGNKKSSY